MQTKEEAETKGGAEMTTDELDRLAELEAVATKGPWKATARACDTSDDDPSSEGDFLGWEIDGPPEAGRGQFDRGYDAHLIAGLRNAAPDLIALARWAEKAHPIVKSLARNCYDCAGTGTRTYGCTFCAYWQEHDKCDSVTRPCSYVICKQVRELLAAFPKDTTSPARAEDSTSER